MFSYSLDSKIFPKLYELYFVLRYEKRNRFIKIQSKINEIRYFRNNVCVFSDIIIGLSVQC